MDARLKFVDSTVLLFFSEIWRLRYIENMKKHIPFFLNLYNSPKKKNTPNYIVRRETGQTHIGILILKRTLNWWYKLLVMRNSRYKKKMLR